MFSGHNDSSDRSKQSMTPSQILFSLMLYFDSLHIALLLSTIMAERGNLSHNVFDE